MKSNQNTYSPFHLSSAVFMILALLWLTISIPFVFASQQELAKLDKMEKSQSPATTTEEESTNPMGNTNEEKAPGSTSSVSEEYLHDNHIPDYFFSISAQFYKCENSGIYNAFHGEVHVPPPNVA